MSKQATSRWDYRQTRANFYPIIPSNSGLQQFSLSGFIHGFMAVSDLENTKKLSQHQRIEDRKLFRLSATNRTDSSIQTGNVVLNFSQLLITDKEKEILSIGLNLAIPPDKLDYCAFFSPFELFHGKLNHEGIFERSVFCPASVKAKLKDIAYAGYRSYCRPDFLFWKEEIKTLDDLRKDKNIVIVKPDKGNGAVIHDRNDYNTKMEDITLIKFLNIPSLSSPLIR